MDLHQDPDAAGDVAGTSAEEISTGDGNIGPGDAVDGAPGSETPSRPDEEPDLDEAPNGAGPIANDVDSPLPAASDGEVDPGAGPSARTEPALEPAAQMDPSSVGRPSGGLPGAADLPVLDGSPDAAPTGAPETGPDPAVAEPDELAPAADAPANAFARPLPRVMAVANQKGGVGKTTTAVNLGACLADIGYRVLVVDLDPQGNASTGLGINIRDLHGSMYDVILHDLPIEDCVEATSVRNLFCAPSSLDLAGAEIELVPAFSRELRLKRALAEVADDYDFVLIDCPPSLGLLTVNGLAAANEVVVPIQCEYYALEGLGQLLRNVNLVQRNLNPELELSAIILVMYDARTKLADQVVTEVRAHFGAKVCRNVVPRTVRLSEAPSFGQPIIAFDPTSRGAIAYRELAKEVSGGTPQRAR